MADAEQPPVEPSTGESAPQSSLNILWGVVAFLAVLVVGCLIVIVVLFGRVRKVTLEPPASTAVSQPLQPLPPLETQPVQAEPTAPPASEEPSEEPAAAEPVIQPDSGYAVAAGRRLFPDEKFRAQVSKHSADWQTATVLLGPSAAEPLYRLELEWRLDHYEVTSVRIIQPPPSRSPVTPAAEEQRRPVTVVGEAPQYGQLPDPEYKETFNDGEKATVEVTYDLADPKVFEVYLRRVPGQGWHITGDSLGGVP